MRRLLLLIVISILGALMVAPPALAAPAKTLWAQAAFGRNDEYCYRTYATVLAWDRKSGGAKESFAEVYVSIDNPCVWPTGETIFFGYGTVPIKPKAFRANRSLRRARLRATIPATNPNTNETRDVKVNLTWKASGPLDYALGEDSPMRWGEAVGTVVDDQGVNYDDNDMSFYAIIGKY